MMELDKALGQIAKYRTDEVVIGTMSANLIWPFVSKSDADLLFTDPMGTAPGLALGLALARPDIRVWVFNGDGSMLMYLGSLASIAGAGPSNLVFFLMDNREWGRCGHVPLPSADKLDFATMARGAGWDRVYSFESLDALDSAMSRIKNETGPVFINMRVTTAELANTRVIYREIMVRPEVVKRFGRSGVHNIQAHLAQRPRA